MKILVLLIFLVSIVETSFSQDTLSLEDLINCPKIEFEKREVPKPGEAIRYYFPKRVMKMVDLYTETASSFYGNDSPYYVAEFGFKRDTAILYLSHLSINTSEIVDSTDYFIVLYVSTNRYLLSNEKKIPIILFTDLIYGFLNYTECFDFKITFKENRSDAGNLFMKTEVDDIFLWRYMREKNIITLDSTKKSRR